MTQRVKIEIAIAVTLAVVLGFFTWLRMHDESLQAQAVAEFRTQQLHADNAKLKLENKRLQNLLSASEARTAEAVAKVESARAAASTPREQANYVMNDTPGLHLHVPDPGEPPIVTFPVADTSVLADIIRDKQVAQTNLAGCLEQNGILKQQISTRDMVIANKDEEIALLRKTKFGNTRSKLGYLLKGVAVGMGIAKFLL